MSAVFTPTRHELSVEDCHKLSEAGILHEDSRVELIDGELMDLAPIGAAHMRIVNRLTRLLVLAVAISGWSRSGIRSRSRRTSSRSPTW